MGLFTRKDKNGVVLERAYPAPSKKFKKHKGTPQGNPHPLRPFDGGGANDHSKALDYARWLVRRNGINVPLGAKGVVSFLSVHMCGHKNPVLQAHRVCFGDVVIKIPHWGYDPTIPALDLPEEAPVSFQDFLRAQT